MTQEQWNAQLVWTPIEGQTKPIGPGEAVTLPSEAAIDSVLHLAKELAALPNAFDPVTGRINPDNDKAIFLHATINASIGFLAYPVTYKYTDERTPHADRSH